jgi:hypothetical protein
MDEIAPMLVLLTLILTTGGVILFRPLAKRLGDLLEIMAQQRRAVRENDAGVQMREVVETLNARIALLEERQDFTDALLSASRSGAASELSDPTARSLPQRPVS